MAENEKPPTALAGGGLGLAQFPVSSGDLFRVRNGAANSLCGHGNDAFEGRGKVRALVGESHISY